MSSLCDEVSEHRKQEHIGFSGPIVMLRIELTDIPESLHQMAAEEEEQQPGLTNHVYNPLDTSFLMAANDPSYLGMNGYYLTEVNDADPSQYSWSESNPEYQLL